MNKTLWKLKNVIKNYDWGTIDSFAQLFNIANPNNEPQAEMWMGAHPGGCSEVINNNGNNKSLAQLIVDNKATVLGEKSAQQYDSLPYLFKILSAASPLSIQVHPELSKAKAGFAKENEQGIPLNSPKRNYKDPNHKPELVYAITPFWAMNAFRPIPEIVALFSKLNIETLSSQVAELKNNQNSEQLKQFFHSILTLENKQKQKAIAELNTKIAPLTGTPFDIMKEIIQKYPDDSGVFTPLILNVVELQPGQAMFLHAQTPHAYLKGTSLEIMASSDNVLRAGLTPKFIDIDELFDNTRFESVPLNQLLTSPIIEENKTCFPIPVADFKFEILQSSANKLTENVTSAEILLCIKGNVTVSTSTEQITINPGESVFIAYNAQSFSYQGEGILARAFN